MRWPFGRRSRGRHAAGRRSSEPTGPASPVADTRAAVVPPPGPVAVVPPPAVSPPPTAVPPPPPTVELGFADGSRLALPVASPEYAALLALASELVGTDPAAG